ncbi:MAG TPA: STAS domain-containing protein [Terriglobia bacterium]|nr:STAS domain-containing protein [Terriglobia bacterium]
MSTLPASAAPTVLQLQTTSTEDAILVKCVGHLTFDVAADFKRDIKALIPQTKQLILDLTHLAYMDSAGLGAVVSVYISAKRAGCGLSMINLNKRVKELLGITHLLSVFAACSEYNVKMP